MEAFFSGFLIWTFGVMASGFFFALTHPTKEVEENIGIVVFVCFLWPITMPFSVAVWIGQLFRNS